MSKRSFTLILPYYENPVMLQKQMIQLVSLPDDVRSRLHLIVVDDGSPTYPAITGPAEWAGLASFQLYRVEVDIRWNWLTCRNIGAHHARTDWLLLTDIDHLVPSVTAERIQNEKLDATNVYRFSRRDAPDLESYKPHPNSWLMTRSMFDAIGGYDERFSGFYGTDGMFRDRVRANASKVIMLDEYLIRVPRLVIADASTTRYGRKEKQDGDAVPRIRAEILKSGDLRPHRLTFPYHRVA